MENKIIEFVREFNTQLENTIYYNLLQYNTDGFNEGISLPEIGLWSDNSSYEHCRALFLSGLVVQLQELQEIANPMLVDEVDKFFAQKQLEMKEKFTTAKISYMRIATCRWKCAVSGKYNEDSMDQFMDVLKEDFQYIFEGLKLDMEW